MQSPDQKEMLDRLKLIETMMAEGRRSTERWGWSFLLWGIGPLIAMWWVARWPYATWAWPVMMGVCIVTNGIVLKTRNRQGATTTSTRSIQAVWKCAGATVLLVSFGAAWSGAGDLRSLLIALFALAAVANGTSSLILQWWPQFLAALVWWVACALAFVLPVDRLGELAAIALILANMAFGAWLSYCERSRKDG
jgi:hypothetical protein